MRKTLRYSLLAVLLIFVAPVLAHGALWIWQGYPPSWRAADWSSAGTLPSPRAERQASIRVMAARTGGLKGAVATHTWLLLKPEGATGYDRYEVVGWGSPVHHNSQPPDGRWYSNEPRAIYTLKGPEAAQLIPKIEAAIRDYRFVRRGSYRIWPGPNSNTFVATVLASVPELGAELPPTAIGRDFPAGRWIARLPDGGWSLSLGGFVGVRLGAREGVEVSLGGLVAGVRFNDFAVLLPGFGALGEPF
jgi:hypothetical protein